MDKIAIRGGNPLKGTIRISGAKNAALPLMCGALLTQETLTLTNLPKLADMKTLCDILESLGVDVDRNGHHEGADAGVGEVHLRARELSQTTADYELVRRMRASVLVLGPMLARCGEAKVSLPGGCAIGTRPVDLHLKGLEAMGAQIELEDGYIVARAPKGLQGGEYYFPFVSVGATENLMMAASLANGTTILDNSAREPEIKDLGECLIKMGAKIKGLGTKRLEIEGVGRLHGARHDILPDRIETGTYLMAVGMVGGEVTLSHTHGDLLGAALPTMRNAGLEIRDVEDGLWVKRNGHRVVGTDIVTQPFPGFATDLQAQFMALMTTAEGASRIEETIFENRFMHVPELMRMGADISIKGGTAFVKGVSGLKGAQVMATDLRASSSLVLAGLAAEGETVINRVYHLDRGYEHLEEKLRGCGADVTRLPA